MTVNASSAIEIDTNRNDPIFNQIPRPFLAATHWRFLNG
jgi:hypothetical protein